MWANCMAQNGGDKYKCLHIAKELVIEEGNALAVLFLLSFNGILALVLLGRPSIYRGWYELFKSHLSKPKKEFISFDARRTSEPGSSTYEMLEKEHGLSRSGTGRSVIVKPPVPSVTRSNTSELREYNPVTFSAQMRERLEPKAGEVPPFSPYADSTTSPFSPFKDHPEYFSSGRPSPMPSRAGPSLNTASPSAPFSPYADSPLTPAGPPCNTPGSRGTGIGIAK